MEGLVGYFKFAIDMFNFYLIYVILSQLNYEVCTMYCNCSATKVCDSVYHACLMGRLTKYKKKKNVDITAYTSKELWLSQRKYKLLYNS